MNPRWMSGAVGSMPSLTRSGRPSASLARGRRRAGSRRRCGPARPPPRRLVRRRRRRLRGRRLSPAHEGLVARRPWGPMLDSRPRTGSAPRAVRVSFASQLRASRSAAPVGISAPAQHHRSHERRRRHLHPALGRADSLRPSPPALAARSRTAGGAKPRVRKLRVALVFLGFAALAIVSTIFGMMMAVASDLPQLENRQQYKQEKNSYLYDDHWRPIGIFAPPNHVVIDTSNQISESMKDAIVVRRGQAVLDRPGGRYPRHRPRLRRRRHRRVDAGRLDDRRSSSSRTRSPSRTTAPSSRSCARQRWPTT